MIDNAQGSVDLMGLIGRFAIGGDSRQAAAQAATTSAPPCQSAAGHDAAGRRRCWRGSRSPMAQVRAARTRAGATPSQQAALPAAPRGMRRRPHGRRPPPAATTAAAAAGTAP